MIKQKNVLHLLVLENLDWSPGQLEAEDEWRVIELVTDDQTPLGDQHWQVEAVGGESHADANGGFDAKKLGDGGLKLTMNQHRAGLEKIINFVFISIISSIFLT